jgi:hypothetical protein
MRLSNDKEGGTVKYVFFAIVLIGVAALTGIGCSKEEAKEESRVMVQSVIEDSPSERAGIKPRDVVMEYEGHKVHTINDIQKSKEKVTTDSVDVVVLRDGKLIKLKLQSGQMGVYLKEVLPEIKRRADAVVIEDIAALDWSTGKSNSFLASLEVIAHSKGIDKDYVYLYGTSGAAFRLHFYKGWCPSSPDPTCGYNAGEAAFRALGMKYHSVFIGEEDTVGQGELRKEICVSINKGFPVIAIDLIDVPEWGIVTGYQNAGRDFFCRTYFDRREGYDKADKFPWATYFIDEIGTAPDDIENYKGSFRIALENLTTDAYDEYASGIAAFEYWIKSLETDDFEKMSDEKLRDVSHAHAWIYERLIHDREMAVKYLTNIANQIPGLSNDLNALAQVYEDEVGGLKPSEDVIVYSFDMKSRNDWTDEMRKTAVTRLRKAMAKEREALKMWRRIATGI